MVSARDTTSSIACSEITWIGSLTHRTFSHLFLIDKALFVTAVQSASLVMVPWLVARLSLDKVAYREPSITAAAQPPPTTTTNK
jgi:hypothetical protein